MHSTAAHWRYCAVMAGMTAVIVAAAAPAHAGSGLQQTDTARTAAVQGVLDRVLGPAGAIATVTDELAAGPVQQVKVRYGSSHPLQVTAAQQQGFGGAVTSLEQQNAVDRTVTQTVSDAAVIREDVSVVVDGSRLGGTTAAQLRHLVSAAAATNAARGDRVSIVVVKRFAAARPVATAAAATSVWTAMPVWVLPAAGATVAALILLMVTALLRRVRRPSSS